MKSIISCVALFFCLIITYCHAQTPQPPDRVLQVITAFRQAQDQDKLPYKGNCHAIAYIKGAMIVYGIDSVLASAIPQSNDSPVYEVVLRNGDKTSILQSELQQVLKDPNHGSGFHLSKDTGDPNIMFKANFIYAVMAKRMIGRKDIPRFMQKSTFEQALDVLKDGVNTPYKNGEGSPFETLIGIPEIRVQAVPADRTYLWSISKHVVVAYNGYGDMDGEFRKLNEILLAHSHAITRNLWPFWPANRHPYLFELSK